MSQNMSQNMSKNNNNNKNKNKNVLCLKLIFEMNFLFLVHTQRADQ